MRLLSVLLLLPLVIACQGGDPEPVREEATPDPTENAFVGVVIETMDAGGYTYVMVDTGEGLIWAAGPQQPMEIDDIVVIGKSMAMPNFHSESLDRDFEMIYFVTHFGDENVRAHGTAMAKGLTADPHAGVPGVGMVAESEPVDLGDLELVDRTVAEIYANRAELDGTGVRVRGEIVKALSGIMGKNWLHIQDGTGEPGSNDLTVTTGAMGPIGTKVVVEGRLGVDRDFGSGYNYEVIIEDARVKVQ